MCSKSELCLLSAGFTPGVSTALPVLGCKYHPESMSHASCVGPKGNRVGGKGRAHNTWDIL